MRKTLLIIATYRGSLNADRRKNLFALGGSLARMKKHAGRMSASIMKPQMRTVQPNPRRGLYNIFESAMGKITPPREDPATERPMAAPRFFWKYCPTAAMAGPMLIPIQNPPRIPWQRRKCQYFLHTLVNITDKT